MAVDRAAFIAMGDAAAAANEEERRAAERAARPWYQKLYEAGSDAAGEAFDAAAGAIDAAGGVLGEVGEGFVSSAARARDAYGRFLDARRVSDEPRHVFLSRPDVQEAVDDLESAAVDFVMAPVKVFADHTLAPARSYVAKRIDAAADEGTEVARDLRATETFVSYFMTPEDKLRKAREVEEDTGIPADAFLDDAALYKEALRIHDYTLRKKALMQDAFSMEAVFEEFPEIRSIAQMSPKDAALALHDIASVRQTHGIVESFTHFLEAGNRKLEYDNLQYKMATGTADENDRQRAADLEKLSDSDKKRLPSFFDDPLAMAAGGLASSAPEMVVSLREGLRDGLLTAEAAAIAGAAAGTAIEPVGGTLAGGALGAGGGFVAGFARSVLGSAARRQVVRTAMTRGMQVGMFEGMRRPESGARYAEYGKMKDKEGNPLLSEDERRLYAAVGGAANAAIEMWNAGLFAKPLRGLNLFGREGGYGADAIRAVIDRAKYDAASRESVAFFAKEQVKDVLKIAVTESLEEGAQSLADDLIHNEIVDAADGRAADEAVSPGDMAVRALVRTVEAFPAGVGFGLAAPLGSAGAALRHARRLSSAQAREEVQVQHTLTGTVMLEGLQRVSSSAKLKQTAPDVQEEVIRAQVQGSPFEAAYVDTVAALQSPEGAKDLEAVARAAGISDEELSLTIAREGLLYVPVEKYAQSAASPALLEAVSFSPEADSIARMKMNARALTDAMEQAQKEAVKARTQAVHAIVNAWFPQAPVHADEKEKLRRDADREMAVAAITQDPDSPAHGWRVLYDVFTAERDALLHPALDALARGMKKGVDILQNGADGRGIRVSNNAPWYQEFYAAHGRAPRKDELMELAYLLTVGDVSAPKVEGWMPSSQEAADAMEAARGQLDELNAHIGTLSNIKDRMMQLDAAEVRATQGLTPEAYGVYHAVMAKLREIGGVQAQAARLNALLFAARADAVARVMREKGGRPDYTARDYFDAFVLRDGGRGETGGGFAQKEIQSQKEAVRKQYEGTAQWMKAPNGKATNLTEDQWLTVRTPAFKAWFGDWERAAAVHEIQALVPMDVVLSGKSLDKKAAEEAFSSFGEVENARYDTYATFPKSMVGKIIKHKGLDVSQMVADIPRLFSSSVLAFVEPEYKKEGHKEHPNILAYHHYVNKFTANGTTYYIRFSLREEKTKDKQKKNGKRILHSTGISDIEIYEDNKKDASSQRIRVSDPGEESKASFIDYRLADFFDSVKDCSKVVDENGEPLVVYHGSDADFDVFDKTKGRANMDIQGMFFSPWEVDSKGYGGNVRAFFLNIRKPATDGKAYEVFSRYEGQNYAGIKAREDLENNGYDGAINGDMEDEDLEFVAFEPNQIKSVDNNGAFSPDDANIFHQSAWHGSPQDAVSSEMAAVRKRYEGTPQWMMAPNGKPTNLTEEEWLAVRTPAFKAAFGDWEQVATQRALQESEALPISEELFALEGKELRQAAQEIYRSKYQRNGDSIEVRARDGRFVTLGMRGFREIKQHSADMMVLKIVPNLKEIVEDGYYLFSRNPEKKNNNKADNTKAFHYYATKVAVEGRAYYVRFVVREYANQSLYYDHDLTTVEAVEKDADFSANPDTKSGGEKPTPSVNHSITQWWKGVNEITLAGDVDENGEPLPSVLSSRHNQAQERAIYGEFSKENGKKIITLFAGANPSTMLHEMGHMFLDDLDELAQFDEASAKDLATVNEWAEWHEGAAKEYENTPWAEEFREHEAAIRDALTSGDAIALRAARNRWRHERFARGFELYLYEGKAPSKALRGVFRRFKQLLRRIYQFVKDVGGKPSPEVEAVMARMIASEEEIRAAELDERWRPVDRLGGKEALDDLLGDDVADTYAKWLEEARRDAEDILRARVMKDLRKEARKEFKARVEEERERKRVQLENEPVYLAEAAIRAQGDERAALLFFPSMEAYKEERAKRKSPEEELQDAMEVFAKGLDEELMAAALSDENIARAMNSPESYHRRVAIEREALRAKE